MVLDERWIRARLPRELADQPIDLFGEDYLDGLTVMQKGERGGDNVVVYRAKDEDDLRWWQLEHICRFIKEKEPKPKRTWRYYRDHAENGEWFYVEHRVYDYNAIEDPRLYGFECFLRNTHYGFPRGRWEEKVKEHVRLMNYWYRTPHWDYDRRNLCFIEISDSKEHTRDGVEEPREGSVIRIADCSEEDGKAMTKYSEQDLKYAAEFREEIHQEALAIVRRTRPNITEVIDLHPVEDYFQEHWDYPGKWYTVIAVPYGYGSRKALVDKIVRDTLSGKAPGKEPVYVQGPSAEPGRKKLTDQLDAKPEGYKELFAVGIDRENRIFRAVGTDSEGRYILEQYEEYITKGGVGSEDSYYVLSDLEYRRYARLALLNGQIKDEEYRRLTAEPKKQQDDDPFYSLIAEYSDIVVDYCIVKDVRYCGYRSHRMALKAAFERIGREWSGNPDKAMGRKIAAEEMFSSHYQPKKLNYRKAFLYPPHGTCRTGKDFVRVNTALFPNGTDGLEAYEWDTDWSDYFDDGHEWWGTLCLTVYDKTLDRFAVIMASATD